MTNTPTRFDSESSTRDAIVTMQADVTSQFVAAKSLLGKLDTSSWTPNDLRVYETLVEERRQLELNHHKLAISDIASRSGQRRITTADLKDSVGTKLKYEPNYGTYICDGEHNCVLDDTAKSCHHELCHRATNEGISYLEYDTIMQYDQRLAVAKTARMKDALRKQRDVQLLKDVLADEEWKSKCIKKLNSLSEVARKTIMAAMSQTPSCKPSQVEIELEPDTVPEQVGRALSKIRLSVLPSERNTIGAIALRRLIPANVVRPVWKNPAQYTEYLGPIQVNHLEAAILHIRHVLELNAMLYYENHFCLQRFLEEFQSLAQHKLLPNQRNRPGLTIAEALHSIKISISRNCAAYSEQEISKGPLYKVLTACITVERQAQAEMWTTQEDCARRSSSPSEKLSKIKMKALDESPMPSVSRLALNRLEVINEEYCTINCLLAKARTGLSPQDLTDAALAHIQKLAKADDSKLTSTARSLGAALEDLRKRDELDSETMRLYDELNRALMEADTEAICIESRNSSDLAKDHAETENAMKPVLERLYNGDMIYHWLPGMVIEESQLILGEFLRYSRRFTLPMDLGREAFKNAWNTAMSHGMYRGVGEAFYVFRDIEKDDTYHLNCNIWKSLLDHSKDEVDLLARSSNGISEFFCAHHRAHWCLSSTFVRLLATLPHLSALNPQTARTVLNTLSQLIQGPMICIPEEWRSDLQVLSKSFLDTYGYLILESMHAFGRADVEQVVLTLLFTLGFHTLIIENAEQARANLQYVKSFLCTILKLSDSTRSEPWIQQTIYSLNKLIDTQGLCCVSPDACIDYERIEEGRSTGHGTQDQTSGKQKLSRLKAIPQTKIYPAKASQPLMSDRLEQHKRALADFIATADGKCTQLDRAKILKICAIHIKMMDCLDNPRPRNGHVKHIDQELVNLLWQIFLHAEEIKSTSEPSSSNFGMHNHCNVWELIDSREKICGFVEGHRCQYRNDDDLRLLSQSFTRYAILNGKRHVVLAFERKWAQLRELARELPMSLEIFLSYEEKSLKQSMFDDTTILRAVYSRIDHTYSSDPEFPQLDSQYLLDLLEFNSRRFIEYVAYVTEEIDRNEGKDAGEKICKAMEQLLLLHRDDQPILFDNQDLTTILRAAKRSWIRSPHEDIIFSEDDDEDDDIDTTYDLNHEVLSGITEPDTESIDGDDETHTDALKAVQAEHAIKALRQSTAGAPAIENEATKLPGLVGEVTEMSTLCHTEHRHHKLAPCSTISRPGPSADDIRVLASDHKEEPILDMSHVASSYSLDEMASMCMQYLSLHQNQSDLAFAISSPPTTVDTKTSNAIPLPSNSTSDDQVYQATARHATVQNKNDETSSPSSPAGPLSVALRLTTEGAVPSKESSFLNQDAKSTTTDASFKTALTTQFQDTLVPPSTSTIASTFHTQLLALRSSISSLKANLASNSHTDMPGLHSQFERINQKAHLADLQCGYMVKTLTDEESDAEPKEGKGPEELLEEINEIRLKIAGESGNPTEDDVD